jgi:hypothetical protein
MWPPARSAPAVPRHQEKKPTIKISKLNFTVNNRIKLSLHLAVDIRLYTYQILVVAVLRV